MINEAQLQRIMLNLQQPKAEQFLPHLNQALRGYGIDTMLRTAAFIAQLAHESGEFRYMEEIWGPTDAQRRYEPISTLAARLGNIQAGDGKRFKGRGPIQITGRANYLRYGELLGHDLVLEPELAAQPEVAFSIAGLFWASNGLNEKADIQDFVGITKRINGGTNGLEDRQRYYARAKTVLAEGFIDNPVSRTRGERRAPAVPLGIEALPRGSEAFDETGGAMP
jgi:putative chitinase